MMLLKKLIFIISCWFISASAFSQFYGGNGDGFVYDGTGITSVNNQESYCYGGDGDGTDQKYLSMTINTQNIYCSGGNKDGNDFSSSGTIVQVDQTIYCNGGDGDGHYVEKFGPSVQIIQDFYCSGGPGDGSNYSSHFSPMADQSFYCSGDDGDGFDSESSGYLVQNDQSLYCQGGDQDGYIMQTSGITAPNDASYYCSGGNNSGYHVDDVSGTINIQYFYCNGSTGDGFDLDEFNTAINEQGFYCAGGSSDGFSSSDYNGNPYGSPLFCYGGDGDGYNQNIYSGNVFGANLFCLGGDGDGFKTGASPSKLLGVGIWTGITSTDWNTSTNWKHNTIPEQDDNVTIPAACPNYPVVIKAIGVKYSSLFNIKCNRLEVNPGASLSHSSSLYVEGEMKVAGNYTNTLNTDYSQRIQNGGVLTVTPTGYVKMGNQTSGTGRTDLMINNGGTLNIEGGTLEVDDQIRLLNGGILNMSSGELFVHKYGAGSAMTVTRSAKFYVESGALGEISGGILKICGLESVSGNHALYIEEPGFVFSGDATISFQNGVNPTHFDSGIYTAAGVTLQNLTINKPGNTVSVYNNLEVEQEVHIEANSSLKVEPGFQLTVGQ